MIYLRCLAVGRDNSSTTLSDFRSTVLTIRSSDGAQVIGHVQYKLFANKGMEVIRGESTFFSGECDIEVERLKPASATNHPCSSVTNTRFSILIGHTRALVALMSKPCKTYINQKLEQQQAHMVVVENTYAGGEHNCVCGYPLRQRVDHIEFHSFNCVLGPKIIATEALSGRGPVKWSMYRGELVTIEIRPDFGWVDFLIGPFVGKMYRWFDPADNWNYVGCVYDRFYGGPVF